MQNNPVNIENVDEFDDYIQSLDINQLRGIENSSKFLFTTTASSQSDKEDDFYLEIDHYIQSLQLSELREIEKRAHKPASSWLSLHKESTSK